MKQERLPRKVNEWELRRKVNNNSPTTHKEAHIGLRSEKEWGKLLE